MREFHAAAVEVASYEPGVLTVHFDDGANQYLQLQTPEVDDPKEFEQGYGNVYVELDDQYYSGFNCFSLAELTRTSFRIVLARDKELTKIGEIRVTFDVPDAEFAELQRGLKHVFRAYGNFRIMDHAAPQVRFSR